jgi:hypothetical protein
MTKIDIYNHVKLTAYTSVLTMVGSSFLVLSYRMIINEYYGIAIVFACGVIYILIVLTPLVYKLVTNTVSTKTNSLYTRNPHLRTSPKGRKNSSVMGFQLPLSRPLKIINNGRNNVSEQSLRVNHFDYYFTGIKNGHKEQFAAWILWKFLHDGEHLQLRIDYEYKSKRGKPPGAFSRSTWLGTKWHGAKYRYNFTWSMQSWAMVYGVLRTGIIEFGNITGLVIATGLGDGETLRLSRGAGYVYECVATALLPEWEWLLEIRQTTKLVKTGYGRSSRVNRFFGN